MRAVRHHMYLSCELRQYTHACAEFDQVAAIDISLLGESPVKSSPRNDHGGASAGISATVPLPD
jgi:hypothetical protein